MKDLDSKTGLPKNVEKTKSENKKVIPDLSEKTRLEVANNIDYNPLSLSYENIKNSLQDPVLISILKRKLQSKKLEYTVEDKNSHFLLTIKASHLSMGLFPENYEILTFDIPQKIEFSAQEMKNLQNQAIKKQDKSFQEKYSMAFVKKILRTQI